jgi:hypothetical protein
MERARAAAAPVTSLARMSDSDLGSSNLMPSLPHTPGVRLPRAVQLHELRSAFGSHQFCHWQKV